MRFLAIALFSALLFGFSSTEALASQQGRVLPGGAEIHLHPDSNSPVIGGLNPGDIVRMSSKDKDGWYRVLVTQTKGAEESGGPVADEGEKREFGWIRRETVAAVITMIEYKQAGLQYQEQPPREGSRHWIVINLLYDALALQPAKLQESVGDSTKVLLGHRFGGEFGVRLATTWTLSLYGGQHQFTRPISGGSYSGKGLDLGLMLEYALVHALPWKVGFVLGGGASLNTTVSGSFGGATATSSPASPWEALSKLTFRGYLGSHFAFGLELGFRYIAPFKPSINGAGSDIEVALLAPIGGAGLLIEF